MQIQQNSLTFITRNSNIKIGGDLLLREGENKASYVIRCIEIMREQHIKGSITAHIDDKGNVAKVSVNTIH